MNPASEDIKDIMVDAGIGVFAAETGWGIFIAEEPTKPDQTITVIDTSGTEPDFGVDIRNPSIQILVRGKKLDGFLLAYSKAEEVFDLLNEYTNQIWSGARYIGIWAEADILFVGFDDNKRPQFSLNFRIQRSPTT